MSLTNDDLFTNGRPGRDSPWDRAPTGHPGQSDKHMSVPEPNVSSAPVGEMRTSDSTNGLKEPEGDHQPLTNGFYPWNADIHKNIIKECNQQDHTNWERKLEVLAHLLSIAETK